MNLQNRLSDSKLAGRLVLALTEPITEQFSRTDWLQFGLETGLQDQIEYHPRLLRSLRFGDSDYKDAVLDVIRSISTSYPEALGALINHEKVRPALERDEPGLLSSLGLGFSYVPSVTPKEISASAVVERALADARALLESRGPISCVDRVHTALHGYFRSLCAEAGVTGAEEDSLTALFKKLRSEHPAFKNFGPQDRDLVRIVTSLSAAIDAINTLRNNASVAHPNQVLLGNAEAVLVINSTQSIFHYISEKVKSK